MIGITPAVFTFNGIYWRAPPYCLFPTIRLAYCTGTFRVPCTRSIAAAIIGQQENNLDKEHHKTTLFRGQTARKLSGESQRQTCDNTDKDYKRNTVSNTFIGNTFAQPHNKHTTSGKHDCRRNYKSTNRRGIRPNPSAL